MIEHFNIKKTRESEELIRLSLTVHGVTVTRIMTDYRYETTPKCFLVEDMHREAIHKAVEGYKDANGTRISDI